MSGVWRQARTIADLGHLMADWLEGRGPCWPGYLDDRPDSETDHLVPSLVAMNRAGFVTTNSQPGCDGPGFDGARWRQRAWVEGVVDDRNPLLHRLTRAADRGGMTVIRGRRGLRKPLVLTERNGEPTAAIQIRVSRDQLARDWHGVGRHAMRALRERGAHIAIVDPVWGRDDRLWDVLHAATTTAAR